MSMRLRLMGAFVLSTIMLSLCGCSGVKNFYNQTVAPTFNLPAAKAQYDAQIELELYTKYYEKFKVRQSFDNKAFVYPVDDPDINFTVYFDDDGITKCDYGVRKVATDLQNRVEEVVEEYGYVNECIGYFYPVVPDTSYETVDAYMTSGTTVSNVGMKFIVNSKDLSKKDCKELTLQISKLNCFKNSGVIVDCAFYLLDGDMFKVVRDDIKNRAEIFEAMNIRSLYITKTGGDAPDISGYRVRCNLKTNKVEFIDLS